MESQMNGKSKLVEKKNLLTFILITFLFALWAFANGITNPMVATFQTLMEMPASQAAFLLMKLWPRTHLSL